MSYGYILPKNIGKLQRTNNPFDSSIDKFTNLTFESKTLSPEAKRRLKFLDYYFSHNQNASLTMRHFGLCKAVFYKWLHRYNNTNNTNNHSKFGNKTDKFYCHDLSVLENRSPKPKRLRKPKYSYAFVELIRKLREEYPTFSAKKLFFVIRTNYPQSKLVSMGINHSYSRSTIGRIIKKYKLFFSRNVRLSIRQRSARVAARARRARMTKIRKPYGLKINEPHKYIEFDMKHIYHASNKRYAFVGIDPFTKENVISVAGTPSSSNALIAIKAIIERFGSQITIINDNGSENMDKVYDYLKSQSIPQLFTKPRSPKEKPHVENLIGKLQQECLDQHYYQMNNDELREVIGKWHKDYHFFRPHESLTARDPENPNGPKLMLTPAEFVQSNPKCVKLGLTIDPAKVSVR